MLHRKGYDGMPLLSTFQQYLHCALPVLQVMLLPIRLGLTYIVGSLASGSPSAGGERPLPAFLLTVHKNL